MDLKEREDFDWFESVWILIERKKKSRNAYESERRRGSVEGLYMMDVSVCP